MEFSECQFFYRELAHHFFVNQLTGQRPSNDKSNTTLKCGVVHSNIFWVSANIAVKYHFLFTYVSLSASFKLLDLSQFPILQHCLYNILNIPFKLRMGSRFTVKLRQRLLPPSTALAGCPVSIFSDRLYLSEIFTFNSNLFFHFLNSKKEKNSHY